MSIEFYLSWYIDGQPQEVSITDIRTCMGDCVVEEEPNYWRLHYDELPNCHLSLGQATDGYCDYVAVIRPCDHSALNNTYFGGIARNGIRFCRCPCHAC